MRWRIPLIGCIAVLWILPTGASAAALTYRYQHHLFTIAVGKEWQEPREAWTYQGQPVKVPAAFRVDGDRVPSLPSGFVRSEEISWNHDAIRAALKRQIASTFDRSAGSVVIRGGTGGTVTFEGVGMLGRRLDLERAVTLTVSALEEGISDITLP
ncbi:MAG: hypothetical protein Q7S29_05850, partial [Candidatus Peribacter sp.]|nr:hypothetical protein [Candidatus Peribacter sp.]